MTGLTENYLREVEASLRADPERKRQIVDELRSHLQEKIDDLKRESPERAYEEIEREVLHEMGSPRDLALAYEPDGLAVLKNQAGETVVRFSRAVGRGASYVATDLGPRAAKAAGRGLGRAFRVAGIALVVLLLLGVGVGAWAYHEFKPALLAAAEDSVPLYDYNERCRGAPCDGDIPGGVFYVHGEARHVRFVFHLEPTRAWDSGAMHEAGAGNVSIRVTDPEGNVRFERAILMSNQSHVSHAAKWAAIEGNWTVSLRYEAFVGEVDVRTWAWSAPWPDL